MTGAARFDDRVAIITGSGNSLGREYALELAARGARVVVNDRPEDGGAPRVVQEIVDAGGIAVADEHPAGTPESARATLDTALTRFGRVDIVVTSAAVPPQSPIEDTLEVDVLGAFHLVEAVWPHLVEQGYGRIVTTTSPVALFGSPIEARRNPYATAKGAMVGLSKNLAAVSLRHGIHVNVLAPWGRTRRMSAMPPDELAWMQQHFPPQLVAPVVAWLCHEACTVNGEIIGAAGGRAARLFIGETLGFSSPRLSVEELLDNTAAVLDPEGYRIPRDQDEELALIRQRLGIGGPA